MKLNKTFIVYGEIKAAGVEHEEYEIEIPAMNKDMAETAGKKLCQVLGLTYTGIFEKDWK